MFTIKGLLGVILISVISPVSLATIDLTDNLSLSGFASTSIVKSDNRTPLFIHREVTDEVCYDCETTLGLQLDYQFLDDFSSSIQVVKRPEDNWSSPEVEWLYIGYN